MELIIENGDCLELMKELPDNSVDLFVCDLPYGETNCSWDSKIDLEKFWAEFRRLRKSKRTACIHFCSTKFGYTLIKSNETMFKMDMVWKKRNKTGGLQSRHRPMRNHEMVYFFYEQAPKYNRDKYHKRIAVKNDTINNTVGNITNAGNPEGASNFSNGKNGKFFEPPNPASVVEEKNKTIKAKDRKAMGESSGIYSKENQTASSFNPPNPASVLEEHNTKNYETKSTEIHERTKAYMSGNKNLYDPRLPASVVEEKSGHSVYGTDLKELQDFEVKDLGKNHRFKPPNPASVVEEDTMFGETKKERNKRYKKNGTGAMEPPNPASVVEEPVSMFESKKVFIGKRHHQTEKPLDILEFFLKYWTDEGDTVLDPTMGSGSTGVACKTLNRKFIGFELDETIFKVAEKRLN
jgi:DNA modification methylase